MRAKKLRLRLALSVGLSLLVATLASLHITRQFDLHHQGLIASKLIALSESKSIHSEVFSQYGPLLTWSQLPLQSLGQSAIITIAVWTVLVLGITTFMLVDLGRVAPASWMAPQWLTATAGLLWVALDPTWREGSLTGWSSLLADALIVGAIYSFALGHSAMQAVTKGPRTAQVTFALSGLLIGIAPFARINSGIAASMVLAVVVALMVLNAGKSREVGKLLGSGFALGLAIPTFSLVVTGSLGDYWNQSVIGPFQWASTAVEPGYWNTWQGLLDRFAVSANRALPILLLALLLMGISAWLLRKEQTKLARFALSASGIVFLVLGGYLSGAVELGLRFARNPGYSIAEFFTDSQSRLYQEGLFFFVFSFLIFASFVLARILSNARLQQGQLTNSDIFELLLWGLALSLLIQIVPTYDTRHVWWGLPLVVLALLRFLSQVSPSVVVAKSISAILVLSFVPWTIVSAVQELRSPLVAAPSDSFASGAFTTREIVVEIEDQLEIVREIDSNPALSPTYFMVRDGSVAGIDGTFRSDYPEFVWWASRPSVAEIDSTPWSGLVVDSWVAKFLGYESVEDLVQEFEPSSTFCSGLESKTTYCVVGR